MPFRDPSSGKPVRLRRRQRPEPEPVSPVQPSSYERRREQEQTTGTSSGSSAKQRESYARQRQPEPESKTPKQKPARQKIRRSRRASQAKAEQRRQRETRSILRDLNRSYESGEGPSADLSADSSALDSLGGVADDVFDAGGSAADDAVDVAGSAADTLGDLASDAVEPLPRTAASVSGFGTPGGDEDDASPFYGQSPEERAQSTLDAASFAPGGFALRGLTLGGRAAGRTVGSLSTAQKAARPSRGQKITRAAADDARRAGRAAKGKAKRTASAPRRATESARQAPRAARRLKTKEGRQAARGRIKRAARRRPIMTGLGTSAGLGAAGVDGPGDVNQRSESLVAGHGRAVAEDPLGTAGTTARVLPAAVAGVGQMIAAPAISGGRAASSAAAAADIPGARSYSGSEIADPVEETGSEMATGLAQMAAELGSGDTDRVTEAVKDDVGLALLIPGTQAIRRTRGSSTYQAARARPRGRITKRRAASRQKRRSEGKQPKPAPPRDRQTGEEFMMRRLGQRIENRRDRVEVSRAAARAASQGRHEGKLEAAPVIASAERLEKKHPGASDAVATASYYGLNPASRRFDEQLATVERSLRRPEDPDDIPPGLVDDVEAIAYMRQNPQAVKSPEFQSVLDSYRNQARRTETSERAKYFGPAQALGVKLPEERVAEVGVKALSPDQLRKRQAEMQNLRTLKRETDLESRNMEPGTPAHAAALREVTDLDAQINAIRNELIVHSREYLRAHQSFKSEVREAMRQADLQEPSYVKDVDRGPNRPAMAHAADFPGGTKAEKQHLREGSARERGLVDRSFDTLVQRSIIEPRVRRAQHRFINDLVEDGSIPIPTANGARVGTTAEITRAYNRGEFDPRTHVTLHSQHFKQAALDPHRNGVSRGYETLREALNASPDEGVGAQIAAFHRGDVEGDLRAREADPGRKYVVIRREAAEELLHNMAPLPTPLQKARKVNSVFSRAILGYSPSWAMAQIAVEGVPALISSASLNPAHWRRVSQALREERKMSPADRAAIDGTVGESLGVLGMPPKTQLGPGSIEMLGRASDRIGKNKIARGLMAVAKGKAFHGFDRWKGGKYRKFIAAAKADKELNGLMRGVGGTMVLTEKMAKDLRGKPLAEQMAYIGRNPKMAARWESYIDDILGNWRALSRFESYFAPAVMFYPFVRYSLRWTFQSFPKQHPVRAQILYFMAQQNSEQLEKLLGAEPVDPLSYAYPVVHTGEDEAITFPGGRRTVPGMNALTESIGRGNIEGILSGLQPGLSIPLQTITGQDFFTGEEVDMDRGFFALHQLLSVNTPSRFFDAPDKLVGLLGGDTEQGPISEALDEVDPARDERSALVPYIPRTDEQEREWEEIIRALEEVTENKPDESDYIEAADDPEMTEMLDEADRRAAEAQEIIDRYASPHEDPDQEERVDKGFENFYDRPSLERGESSSGSSALDEWLNPDSGSSSRSGSQSLDEWLNGSSGSSSGSGSSSFDDWLRGSSSGSGPGSGSLRERSAGGSGSFEDWLNGE